MTHLVNALIDTIGVLTYIDNSIKMVSMTD
jgi:hypothetical protein